jgi:hypothetical protein
MEVPTGGGGSQYRTALTGTAHGRHEAGATTPARGVPSVPAYRRPLAVDRDAVRCILCDVPIERWTDPRTGTPWWRHTGPAGTFWCRGQHGMILDNQIATPPPDPPAPGTHPPAPARPDADAPPASTARPRPPRGRAPVVGTYPSVGPGHPGNA